MKPMTLLYNVSLFTPTRLGTAAKASSVSHSQSSVRGYVMIMHIGLFEFLHMLMHP
mgnify:CR=1 FL=1